MHLKGNNLVVDRTSVPEPLVYILRAAPQGTAPRASLSLGILVRGPSCWRDSASQHVNRDEQVGNETNEVYECFLLWANITTFTPPRHIHSHREVKEACCHSYQEGLYRYIICPSSIKLCIRYVFPVFLVRRVCEWSA